ncbi:MAG: EAL domain-containing protein [Agathobacter sp.]|nr:EAL domain-containing protein [Agathobacter sp.]MDY4892423.1 EAL domain-containing protein [Agathobacter sp.]
MRNYVKQFLFRFESSFFSKVLRRALGMMIPLILTGGMALALRNLPIPLFQAMIETGSLHWLYDILTLIYEGTFGLFSVVLVVTISLSYAMELNVAVDYMVMYVIVALSAFGAQVNIGTDYFDIKSLGSVGCFSAILVAYLSCMAYSALRKIRWLILENFTAGMGGICLPAFQTFFPLLIICSSSAVINRIICMAFHVHGSYELINVFLLTVFKGVAKGGGFTLGLLYTVFVHLLWFFGLHGSHILEPVAQNDMICNGVDILSKSFYDVFVSMGGSGTTVCVIIALLMLYRRERSGKLAGLATVTGLFNINEILTFGLPIILNPILFVPFILTPVACYCISYGATAMGLVPVVTHEVVWTAPVLVGGYLATGSIRGTLLQLFCIGVGVLIYIPFLRANQKMETIRAKEQVRILIKELQSKEENIEHPMFLTRGDHIGTTSRLLLHDLKHAVKNRKLHILYQPQVRADGSCIGAEALLRWNHPLYGMIYPPLIIYLAEEGKILPDLEKLIIDEVVAGIARTKENYSGEFKISVNFTAHSLLWDCENYIEQELERNHVEPDKLWIEITEQDILIKTDLIMKKLNQLKENGHRLLIDDFGMGHTSLLYLQSEIFSVVKLDGSLTRPLLTSETNQKIVSSIVELGNELNVDVIAEYVETREQQKLLEKLGCTCYQGYLYSKPIPLDEFIQYIRKNQTENE